MNRIQQLAINDEGFVFDPLSGESFTVNETGKYILDALKKSMQTEEIISEMISDFDVNEDAAQRDVSEFITHLRTLKLI